MLNDIIDRGLDRNLFSSAEIGYHNDRKMTGTYLVMKSEATVDGATILPTWEATLASSATAERLQATGIDEERIGFAEIEVRGPDGEELDAGGVAVNLDPKAPAPAARDLTDTEIEIQLRASSEQLGWTVEFVKVLHPLAPAVILTVQPPADADASLFWALYKSIRTSGRSDETCDFQGLLVQVVNPEGKPLAAASEDCRAGIGSTWSKDDGPIQLRTGNGTTDEVTGR